MMTIPFSVGKLLENAIARVRRLICLRGFAVVGIVWILAVVAVMIVDSRIVIFDDRIRWAMSLGAVLLALVTSVFTLVLPLRRKLDFGRMARLFDARHPEMEERFSTLIELSSSDPNKAGFSASLLGLVGELTERDLGKVDLKHDFPARAALRRFAVFAALALALVTSIAVSPHLIGRLFVRAVAPWADIGNLFSDDITVKPGDIVALSGTVIRIEATDSTVPSAPSPTGAVADAGSAKDFSIRISRKTRHGWTEETVEPLVNGVYETTADPNEREWRYRVTAGPAVTRYYHVRVSMMPKYELFQATVTYPEYTGMNPLVVSNADVGAIRAIEGSRVKFDLRVTDPDTLADFRIDKEPVFEHVMVSNRTSNWSLDLVNRDGFRSEKGTHPLTSFIDQPPTVVIEKPAGTLRLPPHAKIPVEITANDDVAITSAYMRVSIDGEPWARHYGSEIDLSRPPSAAPATQAFLRRTVDVDLSLYDLILAKNVRFDVVVWDGCPAEFGGAHSATSAPFTVQFAANEVNWDIQELRNEVAEARRDIDEARRRLGDAQNEARRVTDALRREQKVSESTERQSEHLAHELSEAEKRIEELRDQFLADERFAPLSRPLDRLLDETVKPALEAVENAQFRDREERAEAVADALPEMEKARQALEDFSKQLTERADKVDAFEKARDLAARQEALARTAKEIMAERPVDTAKLEAWKRLEEAAMQKADELARQAPDSDFAEAKRKMETAAREMAELKREMDAARDETNRLAKAAAEQARQAANQELRKSQELAQAAADQERALDALARTNLTAAALSQQSAQNRLKNAEALPAVKALQKLATEAAPFAELAQPYQKAAAEAVKQEQALREALASPTNRVDRQALEKLDAKLRAELPKRQAALDAARAEQEKAKSSEAGKAERAQKEESRRQQLQKALDQAAEAQKKAQEALDAVAAKRAAAAEERRSNDTPLDAKHQAALAEKAKEAAASAQQAAAAQHEAEELLKRGEATEGTKAMQQLADKAAAASQRAPHDVGRARRAAAAQQEAQKALAAEKALREAMASGEKTAADLEALDRAMKAEAKRQETEFEKAESAAKKTDGERSAKNNEKLRELYGAMGDENRATAAMQQAAQRRADEAKFRAAGNQNAAEQKAREAQISERQAAEAQRAAEDRLERGGAQEAVKALQQEATTAGRNARKAPRTKEKFDLAEAAQKAAAEALQNELKIREGIRRGEMTEDDLAALDDRLKEGLLQVAAERTKSARAAAENAVRAAKDAVGSEEEETLGKLADTALEAVRDAVSSELSESKLMDDDRRAEKLRGVQDTLDALASETSDEAALEDRILAMQQAAAEALKRNDRHRARALQKDIARAQARAADRVNEEDEVAARTAANAAQDEAAQAVEKAVQQWNNDEARKQALAAQEGAMEKERAAQNEARAVRALDKLSAAEQAVSSQPSETSQASEAAQTSSEAAEAAAEASDAMDREVNAQAAALGMSKRRAEEQPQGGAKGKGDEKNKSSGGGGVSEEVKALAKELQRKDSPDFFKNLFMRHGWFKIRGLSKDGLGARDLKDVPREYRDLVRRYFLKLSEENP